MKTCRVCREIKPSESYSRDSIKFDGLRSVRKRCDADRVNASHEANRDERTAYMRKYHRDNRPKLLEKMKARASANPAKRASAMREWYLKNKEYTILQHREYRKKNPQKVAFWSNRRRAAELNASPGWLTDQHRNQIELFYVASSHLKKETDASFHVDHIVPLQGKNVCGLHVPWNLQVLEASVNTSKKNKVAA